jgi:hypothetical protein
MPLSLFEMTRYIPQYNLSKSSDLADGNFDNCSG